MKILVSDPIAEAGIARLQESLHEVVVRPGMSREELVAVIGDFDALVVRSETKVTREVIQAAHRLKVIGRAGVGVDNIDVEEATRHGILVVNSPEGNKIAAAELTVALLLALSRRIPQATLSLKSGEWKRSKFLGEELFHKTLGVIGLGKIGAEVARRALGFEMRVLGYDPYVSAEYAQKLGIELVDFDRVLTESDFITLHVPMTRETRNLIGREQLARMKKGVHIINCSRGGILDEMALVAALESGRVAGAALDVFEQEPPPADHPLFKLDSVVVTPHLGASTQEAQVNVAVDVAEQILEVLAGRPARSAVNMPPVSPEVLATIEPFLRLGEKMGKLHTHLADGRVETVEIAYSGELAQLMVAPITRAVLKGLLEPVLTTEGVNLVNAPAIAEMRQIRVTESKTTESEDYTSLLNVKVTTDKGKHTIAGTLIGRRNIRIVRIDGYYVDIVPEGIMIIAVHTDRPGIIGRVGTLLGNNGINIAGMHVGREAKGSRAVMVLIVDDPVPLPLLEQIRQLEGMENARLVEL